MKIQTSILVSNMAGSLNGSTVRRSRYGLVLQNKASGLQNNTTALGIRRSMFAYFANEWGRLSPTEKQGWQTVSGQNPQTDKFGNPIILSGYAYYAKIQNTLLTAGYPILPVISYDSKVDTITSLSITQNGVNKFDITANLSGVNYTENLVYFAVKVPEGSETPFLNYKRFSRYTPIGGTTVFTSITIDTVPYPIPQQWYIGAFIVTDHGGISPTVLAKADW